MATKLPNRWLDYSPIGSRIEGTCFIAFKVPLKKEFFHNCNSNIVFTPSMVKDQVADLKTIVDLTNTNRYYDPKEFTERNVHYEKIYCMGHEIPKESVIKKFFSIVDDHLGSNTNEGTNYLIGVHCTHGLNRTGYLICRYMVTKLGFSPHNAITAFERARGHHIERKNYIHDLFWLASGSNPIRRQDTAVINRGNVQPRGPSRALSLNWRAGERPPPNEWLLNNVGQMRAPPPQSNWRLGNGDQITRVRATLEYRPQNFERHQRHSRRQQRVTPYNHNVYHVPGGQPEIVFTRGHRRNTNVNETIQHQ